MRFLLFFICFNIYAYPLGIKSSNVTTKYPSLFDVGFLKTSQSGSTTTVTSLGVSVADSLVIGGSLNSSALLDVQSTSKGFLPPRMTTAQRTAISSPATGLFVYDTDLSQLYFYNGSAWTSSVGSGAVTTPNVNGTKICSFSYSGAAGRRNLCTSSPCTLRGQNQDSCVSSITRSATGIYVVNFKSGQWSNANYDCTYKPTNYGGSGAISIWEHADRTSTALSFTSETGGTSTDVDSAGDFICVGI